MTGIDKKIVHLRYCRLVSEFDAITLQFEGAEYRLVFADARFAAQKGYLLERVDGQAISTNLLLWLSLYIGEDAIDPFREIDTRFNWHRGDFRIEGLHLQGFLDAAHRMQKRKWPKWRLELLESALTYSSAAIRSGLPQMPLSLGLFALSLECLGNVRHGKRDKHFTFGDNKFLNLLTTRLVKLKQDPAKKDQVRAFERRLKADIDLLNALRNAFYGHSLLHLTSDRRRLALQLQKWMLRYGHHRKFAKLSIKVSRLREDVVRESPALYKLGLRLNRLFIFLVLGIHRRVPFATHDFQYLGDHRDNELSEHRGIKMRFSILTAPGKPSALAFSIEARPNAQADQVGIGDTTKEGS